MTTTDWNKTETIKVSYDSDNLKVTSKKLEFLKDPRFIKAYKRGMNSGHKLKREKGSDKDIHIEYRVYMLLWAATHAMKLPGDFVECGVNTGICSLAICDYTKFDSQNKRFYLFDTFNGIPESQMSNAEFESRKMYNEALYEECYQQTLENFVEYPNVMLIRGEVPDTLESVDINEVSYLHLDMNIAHPEAEAIRHFWPKIVPSGIIMLDDYAWHGHGEQRKAMDSFAREVGVSICTLPTGQGMIIKAG